MPAASPSTPCADGTHVHNRFCGPPRLCCPSRLLRETGEGGAATLPARHSPLGRLQDQRVLQPTQGSCSPLWGWCPPGQHEGGRSAAWPVSQRRNIASASDTEVLTDVMAATFK